MSKPSTSHGVESVGQDVVQAGVPESLERRLWLDTALTPPYVGGMGCLSDPRCIAAATDWVGIFEACPGVSDQRGCSDSVAQRLGREKSLAWNPDVKVRWSGVG